MLASIPTGNADVGVTGDVDVGVDRYITATSRTPEQENLTVMKVSKLTAPTLLSVQSPQPHGSPLLV